MTARISWSDSDVISGSVGTLGPFFFQIVRVYLGPKWMLTADGLGRAFDDREPRSDDQDELKAEAGRWVAEFVSSLGAVFPDEPVAMLAGVTDEEAFEAEFRARYAPGRRVRFAHPDRGYLADQEVAAAILAPGEVYTIAWSDIGFSSTSLGLAGIEPRGQGFNSVLFEPVPEEDQP